MKVINRHPDNKPHYTLLDFFGWLAILLSLAIVTLLGWGVYEVFLWLAS